MSLNEFNRDLLSKAVALYELENIKKLLGMNHSTTHTVDDKEFQGLDPWVQWVSYDTELTRATIKLVDLVKFQNWKHLVLGNPWK